MEAITDDDEATKWTTVHSRYHVSGCIAGEWELIEAVQTRREAMRLARRSLGPAGYEQVSVYDSMARVGMPQRWSVDANSETVEARRG